MLNAWCPFRGSGVLFLFKLPVLVIVVAAVSTTTVIVAEVALATTAALVAFEVAAAIIIIALFKAAVIIKMHTIAACLVYQLATGYFSELVFYHVVMHGLLVPVGIRKLHVVADGLCEALAGFLVFLV